MANLDSWVEIPPYATPIARGDDTTPVNQESLQVPSSPRPSRLASDSPASPAKASSSSIASNLTNAMLTAALNVPTPSAPSDPRKTAGRLLSTRDSLSIPITAVNFRSVRHPADKPDDAPLAPAWVPAEAREGSSEWFANLQAIQNLMGFYADMYENVTSLLPHLTHATPTSAPLLTFLLVTLLLGLPLLPLVPLRPVFLIVGIAPFILTHPTVQRMAPAVLDTARKLYFTTIQRFINNDRLEDTVWAAPIREVELWENERWSLATSQAAPSSSGDPGWSKANLRRGERKGWSRRRDGWSDADALDGSLEGDIRSNLTFTLEPGWHFIPTEDWQPDIFGSWVSNVGGDADGWVYTNDVWNDPHAEPPEEWKLRGMTRRRRWVRRIYFVEPVPPST
ncbi:SubName: Full=Uncharacterized protein {ECO:0000313/EMBL:CCA73045.1} [Serendipita indica DSM 11827]|nr:SubName: Full=Uncharacterized protein {ECO:0000313/EMBL:CCA73045.1} [Serendipita indica DSM 11827]